MNNYSEQIFQSIDTIISQRLNEVKFDRTITCEVIAEVKDYPNKYWVSDGAIKFQACVTDSSRTYTEKQKVYVLIPNGDYNSTDKVIIGSYTADKLPKNLYTNPFDHLVYSSKVSFTTTTDKYIETSIDTENLVPMGEQEVIFNYSNTTPFNYIGLEFSFNTTDLYGMKKGNYGIQFSLKNGDAEIFTSAIDSSQLYGDIYNFNSLMKMQHLFPIPTGVDITQVNKLVINLYQKGNFNIAKKKIYLKSATFYFGYDVEKIDSNKLTLYLDQSQTLTFNKSDLKRKLYLEWQDADLGKIYTSDIAPSYENYEIYWCKYVAGSAKTGENDIEETGTYWETISPNKKVFDLTVNLKNVNTQQFKVGVRYKEKDAEEYSYLESNILIFTNEIVQTAPGATSTTEDGIRLTCSDSGIYNYYNSYGEAIDNKACRDVRTITAAFLDGYDINDPSISVTWTFPNENTMLIAQSSEKAGEAKFTIATTYSAGKNNNTIYCQAFLPNGERRSGKITFRFGEASTAGSQYAFNIQFPEGRSCLYIGEKTPVQMQYTFERLDGETIADAPVVTWSWLLPEDHGDIVLADNGALTPPEIMPEYNHAVLIATISNYTLDNGLQSDLTAYMPIPLSASEKYQYISGPTKIIYDTVGTSILSYSKSPYKIYPESEEKITWQMEDNVNGPKLDKRNYLQPLAVAPSKLPVVELKAFTDYNVIWKQPIYSIRERYFMSALNDWNGKLRISDTDNSIFAATVAAGGKDENNTFSGVLMGRVLNNNKELLETGLYGLDEGVTKFYLNTAGAFYVGDGKNYISFNDIQKGTKDSKTGEATLAVSGIIDRKVEIDQKKEWSWANYEAKGEMSTSLNSHSYDKEDLTYFNGLTTGFAGDVAIQHRSSGALESLSISKDDSELFQIGTLISKGSSLRTVFKNSIQSNGIDLEISCKGNLFTNTGTEESTPMIFLDCGTGGQLHLSDLESHLFHEYTSATTYVYYGSGVICKDNSIEIYTGDKEDILNKGYVYLTKQNGEFRTTIQSNIINLGDDDCFGYLKGTWTGTVTNATTSDYNYKNSITNLSTSYNTLFDNLSPKIFKYNDGTSNRFHTGFIAQDVNKAVEESGLTSQDFAASILLNQGKEDEHWALRYEEFIALNTWQIQKLKQRVAELENEIKEIKQNEIN